MSNAPDKQSTKFKDQSSDKTQTTSGRRVFDLEERMAVFGEDVILFCKTLKKDNVTNPLINQIVRSATSVGANYCEANNGSSKKDFRNKTMISKKEAQETKHWLRMLKSAQPDRADELRKLWSEAHELTLILQTIINKTK